MISWIIMAVLGAAFALLSHEAAHAFAAKMKGARVTVFKPWPHFRNGRLYFGYCETMWKGKVHKLFHIAPLYKDLILVPVFLGLAFLWLPFIVVAGWLVVDSIWWLIGAKLGPGYDAWKYFN
jgi:hypothetical protein